MSRLMVLSLLNLILHELLEKNLRYLDVFNATVLFRLEQFVSRRMNRRVNRFVDRRMNRFVNGRMNRCWCMVWFAAIGLLVNGPRSVHGLLHEAHLWFKLRSIARHFNVARSRLLIPGLRVARVFGKVRLGRIAGFLHCVAHSGLAHVAWLLGVAVRLLHEAGLLVVAVRVIHVRGVARSGHEVRIVDSFVGIFCRHLGRCKSSHSECKSSHYANQSEIFKLL